MEGAADDHEMETAEGGAEIIGAGLDEADLAVRRRGILRRDPQHLGLRIDRGDLTHMGRECDRDLPGAAAEIHHPGGGAGAGELD